MILVYKDCSPACQTCDQLEAILEDEAGDDEEDDGEYIAQGPFVRTDFGVAQHLGWDEPDDVAKLVERSHEYLEELQKDPEFQDKVDGCRNHLRDCSLWAWEGAYQ
jgi:hypothetical protein